MECLLFFKLIGEHNFSVKLILECKLVLMSYENRHCTIQLLPVDSQFFSTLCLAHSIFIFTTRDCLLTYSSVFTHDFELNRIIIIETNDIITYLIGDCYCKNI